jgi:hypothetical protein
MRYNQEILKRAVEVRQAYELFSTIEKPIKVATLFDAFHKDVAKKTGINESDFVMENGYQSASLKVRGQIFGPRIYLFPQKEDSPEYFISMSYGKVYRVELGVSYKLREESSSIEEIVQHGEIRLGHVSISTAHHFHSDDYFFKIQEGGDLVYLGFSESDFRMDNWVHTDCSGQIVETLPSRSTTEVHIPDTWSVITPDNLPTESLLI